MKIINLLNQRFEKALVLSRAPNHSQKDTNARWNCLCDCGKQFIAYGQDLRRGKTKSCGCLTRNTFAERVAGSNRTHGMSKTAFYRNWKGMHNRCNDPNKPSYLDVKVCERWFIFENFQSDMGLPPKGHTLDRIDPFKDYSPENCRWSTHKTQANNRRKSTIRLDHDGMSLTIEEWGIRLGITNTAMYSRVQQKFPPEKLFAPRLRSKPQ